MSGRDGMSVFEIDEFVERLLRENEESLKQADISVVALRHYLLENDSSVSGPRHQLETIQGLVRHPGFVVSALKVPNETSQEYQRILTTLRKLRRIWFKDCEFHCESFDFDDKRNAACCFERCTFQAAFTIQNGVGLSNASEAMFHLCRFAQPVRLSGVLSLDDIASDAPLSAFSACTFESGLELCGARLTAPVFLNDDKLEGENRRNRLSKIQIKNSTIEARFILNDAEIESFECKDSVFSGKFEMKHCLIKDFRVENTNYSKLVDFFETTFNRFILRKSILSDFVGFEGCVFGDKDTIVKLERPLTTPRPAVFEYATFMSFTNFRNTRFYTRLDLRNSNRKESPNFIGCYFAPLAEQTTDRETFRIIKHSFDAVGNHVDGNAFFAKEMRAYRRELKGSTRYAERFLLWCNLVLSDFGQNWWLPIFWLVVSVTAFAGLRYGHRDDWLYRIYPEMNDWIAGISFTLNEWSKGLKVFTPLMFGGMEFLSLVFGVLFSILIWLAVVSIRRHSKR